MKKMEKVGPKKGLAIIIASKMKEKSEGKNMEDEEMKYGEMGQEMLDAIKANDSKGFASALKSFIKICMGE